jgi:hypothetical protein
VAGEFVGVFEREAGGVAVGQFVVVSDGSADGFASGDGHDAVSFEDAHVVADDSEVEFERWCELAWAYADGRPEHLCEELDAHGVGERLGPLLRLGSRGGHVVAVRASSVTAARAASSKASSRRRVSGTWSA